VKQSAPRRRAIAMQAAIMTEPYQIQFKEVPRPVPGPGEVLVRVAAAGICGSDIHFYDGSNPYARYPQIFGHELSGVIEETGEGVPVRRQGERVVIEPAVPCGKCYPCRIGKFNACSDIAMIGSVRAGGFADYVLVPQQHVHVMPDGMSFETGALCEPFTIGAQAIQRANLMDGQTVAIIGMGPIGLTILTQIKRQYKVKIIVLDVVTSRLELALALGADEVINSGSSDALEEVLKLTDGEGANIVIESAGIPATIEQTIHLVSPGGRIVIVGLTGKDVSFPGQLLTKKDVELFGTRHSVNKFPEVIRFLEDNPDVAEAFISKVMPFKAIEEALVTAKNQPEQMIKIVLSYS
jgi:threonine dehydrogenase-like Zn-dependent dehydrogenase